jgi:hypothetical protein
VAQHLYGLLLLAPCWLCTGTAVRCSILAATTHDFANLATCRQGITEPALQSSSEQVTGMTAQCNLPAVSESDVLRAELQDMLVLESI